MIIYNICIRSDQMIGWKLWNGAHNFPPLIQLFLVYYMSILGSYFAYYLILIFSVCGKIKEVKCPTKLKTILTTTRPSCMLKCIN